jgi:sugar phosphate isomerase/epimerase
MTIESAQPGHSAHFEKSRRHFLTAFANLVGGAGLAANLPAFAAIQNSPSASAPKFNFDISLAQWSLHKAFFAKEITPLDFPVVARKTYDIGAVEYVNQFFIDKAQDQTFLRQLKQRAADHGVTNSLIMIDGEPELSSTEKTVRSAAIEGHKKWIEAARFLGCSAIRVNLHGQGTADDWHKHSVESLRSLCEFSKDFNIKILVENHGGFSSSGKLLTAVMQAVNNPLCGTMPDFGNFCIRRRDGDMWESPCVEQYDIYQGVAELMPYAGAVSAKSFNFDAEGNEPDIDFHAMLKLVKAANYTGYIGIEYEGNTLSEEAGIRATKALLERLREQLV